MDNSSGEPVGMCLQRLAQFIKYCCDICDVTVTNINILYQHVPTYIKMCPLWSTTVNYYQVSSAHNLISVIINIHQHIYQHNIKTIVNIPSAVGSNISSDSWVPQQGPSTWQCLSDPPRPQCQTPLGSIVKQPAVTKKHTLVCFLCICIYIHTCMTCIILCTIKCIFLVDWHRWIDVDLLICYLILVDDMVDDS